MQTYERFPRRCKGLERWFYMAPMMTSWDIHDDMTQRRFIERLETSIATITAHYKTQGQCNYTPGLTEHVNLS